MTLHSETVITFRLLVILMKEMGTGKRDILHTEPKLVSVMFIRNVNAIKKEARMLWEQQYLIFVGLKSDQSLSIILALY